MTGKRQNSRNSKRYFKKAKFSDGVASKLEVGMQGILVSHDRNKEKFCRLDSFKILNYFADKLYGPEKLPVKEDAQDDSDNDDIESALSKEVEAIKANSSKEAQKNRRFTAVKSGCNNLVFIRFADGISPGTLLENIVKSISSSDDIKDQSFPYVGNVLRVHPVEFSCPAYFDSMQKNIPPFLKTKFGEIEGTVKSKEFNLSFKSRNNTHLDKETVKTDLFKDIESSLPDWKFNCRSHSVLVIIDVLKTVCLVSVVKDFLEFKKYNIRELLQQSDKAEKSSENEIITSPIAGELEQSVADVKDEKECEQSEIVCEAAPS